MIATQTGDVKVAGTLTGQKNEMGIDAAAMAHIMSVLTDLYSDPALAIVREYLTNAWDAHVEAGNTDMPIHVTLPNPLSPFFKVRDFGVGLSAEDIKNIYSRYGASTKRSTNDQVGMLGLGCKSALTYVQQFTLTSIKDGYRVQVAITREETGGSMTVVDERKTDEPNGTEVTIPAKRDPDGKYDTLVRTAHEFVSYWPEGTVLLNGEAPKRVDGFWLTDDILVRSFERHSVSGGYKHDPEHRVVMGNVAYPVQTSKVGFKVASGYEVVCFVPIGTVSFVPSREALNYSDDATVKACTALGERFKEVAKAAVQREIDSAKDHPEAIVKMLESSSALSDAKAYGSYTYKGKEIPGPYMVPGVKTSYPANYDDPDYRILVVPKDSYTQNRADSGGQFNIEAFPQALWVTGYEAKKFSSTQKQKLLKFLETHKGAEGVTKFVLVKDVPQSHKRWIAKDRMVEWADVNAIKLPRTTAYGAQKAIPGSYENCIVDGVDVQELEAKDIDASNPIYTYPGSWYHSRSYVPVLNKYVGKYTIVPLSANRREKFQRNFPTAKPLDPAIRALFDKWVNGLKPDEKKRITISEASGLRAFKELDPSKVDDPDIKAACRIAKLDLTNMIACRKMFENVLGRVALPTVDWENPLEKYPLFSEYNLRDANGAKHTYLYLNAAYAA